MTKHEGFRDIEQIPGGIQTGDGGTEFITLLKRIDPG